MALMRRQSLVKFDAPLCETVVETPKPQGAQVLVRIECCGLCHSDLHIQDGYADVGGGQRLDTTRGMTLPFTLGHEIAGVVDEVGPDAPKDLIGKRTAVFPWIGCGKCRDCLAGDENLCVRNQFLVRLVNKRDTPGRFVITLPDAPAALVRTGLDGVVELAPLAEEVRPLVVQIPRAGDAGEFALTGRVTDEAGTFTWAKTAEAGASMTVVRRAPVPGRNPPGALASAVPLSYSK